MVLISIITISRIIKCESNEYKSLESVKYLEKNTVKSRLQKFDGYNLNLLGCISLYTHLLGVKRTVSIFLEKKVKNKIARETESRLSGYRS